MPDPVPIVTIRCHFCSRQRLPSDIHQMATGQMICGQCVEWHLHALEFLGGEAPRGCQECETSWAMLRDAAPSHVRMYVVPRDGIYQLLCARCVGIYLPKRADLYRGTQFGRETLKI